MATGYTMVSGRPQAVLLHAGVGLLHGSMGILTALQAEMPMVVLSGESVSLGEDPDLPIEPQWYGGLSVGGPERLIEPIVKHARQVSSPFTLYESVVRAGEMAQRSPMGPVYLNVPLEHMLHRWTPPDTLRNAPPAPKLQPAGEEIERIAGMLRRAIYPALVVEAAGRDPAAFAALLEFAESQAMPVIGGNHWSYTNFPADHELFLGIGNAAVLAKSDLVLLVSARAPWYPPRKRPTTGKIVAIHDNPHKAHMVYQNLHADHYLEGDVGLTLKLLSAAAKPTALDAGKLADRRQRWKREREAFITELRAAEDKARAEPDIDPIAVVAAMAKELPPDTVFVDESITHHPLVRQHLMLTKPQSYFRVFGGLGQGLGTALGVKLAAPRRPVVLVAGDGGFLYNPIIQALGAARNHGLPILAVILNNGKYAAMKSGHVHHYPEGVSVGTNLFYGVDIDAPDLAEFAKPFGFFGRKVEKKEELAGALKDATAALSHGQAAILNVMVSR
jgi:acetolactate synthase-1/2/3 large subunit